MARYTEQRLPESETTTTEQVMSIAPGENLSTIFQKQDLPARRTATDTCQWPAGGHACTECLSRPQADLRHGRERRCFSVSYYSSGPLEQLIFQR